MNKKHLLEQVRESLHDSSIRPNNQDTKVFYINVNEHVLLLNKRGTLKTNRHRG